MKKEYELNRNYTGSILWAIIGVFFLVISILAILDEDTQTPWALAFLIMGGIGFISILLGLYSIYASIVIDDFKLTITEKGIFFPEVRDRSITFYDYSEMKSYEIVENQIDKKHALNALEIMMKHNRRVCIANTLLTWSNRLIPPS